MIKKLKKSKISQIVAAISFGIVSCPLGFLIGFHVLTGRYRAMPLPYWGILELTPYWGWVEVTLFMWPLIFYGLFDTYNRAVKEVHDGEREGCRIGFYYIGIPIIIIGTLFSIIRPSITIFMIPCVFILSINLIWLKKKLVL